MKAIVAECTKLGATVEEYRDYCVIHPPKDNKINDNVTIETYDDHRMAMAFAPLSLIIPLRIKDKDVVRKSYPNYWVDLEHLGFNIETLEI